MKVTYHHAGTPSSDLRQAHEEDDVRHRVRALTVTDEQPSREELLVTIASLRLELARLREELRRLRRDENEVPPHYL